MVWRLSRILGESLGQTFSARLAVLKSPPTMKVSPLLVLSISSNTINAELKNAQKGDKCEVDSGKPFQVRGLSLRESKPLCERERMKPTILSDSQRRKTKKLK